jgi:hypothetical protein
MTEMNDKKRTWLRVFVALLILLPGAPYIVLALALVLRPFDLQRFLFVPGLLVHNAYFRLPALLFGKGLYPTEEFGFLPSAAGYIVAAVLYGIIAFGLSLAISAGISRLRNRETDGQPQSGGYSPPAARSSKPTP